MLGPVVQARRRGHASSRSAAGLLAVLLGCAVDNPRFGESADDTGDAEPGSTTTAPTAPTSMDPDGSTSAQTSSTNPTGPSMPATSTGTGSDTGDGETVFRDDAWEGEFELADSTGMRWTESEMELAPNVDGGRLDSRVFDAGQPTQWLELSWQPLGPYGVSLTVPEPADGYARGNTTLDELQLLLRLDENRFEDGGQVEALTGDAAAPRTVTWNGPTAGGLVGVFAGALEHVDPIGDGDISHFAVEPPPEAGEGGFTWATWYRASACDETTTLMALDSAEQDPMAYGLAYLGCGSFVEACSKGTSQRLTASLRSPDADIAPIDLCSPLPIVGSDWHHVALRRTASNGLQNLALFVDGGLVDEETAEGVAVMISRDGTPSPEVFTIAGGNADAFTGSGAYDDAAIWHRALTDDEVEHLYLRGVLEARFQVRACDDPNCPGEAWSEPSFTDPGPDSFHSIDLTNLDLRGRYVQYRFDLGRPAGSTSPAIAMVQVAGQPE